MSVEDQRTADERIPLLLQTPAAVRFVSAEPLLGPVDVSKYLRATRKFHLSASVAGMLANKAFFGLQDDAGRPLSHAAAEAELRALLSQGITHIPCSDECDAFDERHGCPGHNTPSLDWLIVGGESGPKARPCDVAWIRSIVGQCRDANTPCFVKQLGANRIEDGTSSLDGVRSRKGNDPSEWPADLRVREWPEVRR